MGLSQGKHQANWNIMQYQKRAPKKWGHIKDTEAQLEGAPNGQSWNNLSNKIHDNPWNKISHSPY